MSKKIKCVVALLVFGVFGAMAEIVLDFNVTTGDRNFSVSGDRITFDFSIDGAGMVSLVSTPVGVSRNEDYLMAVNSWSSPDVGTVHDPRLFGQSFQLTLSIVRIDRETGFSVGSERLSVNGTHASGGHIGCGGGNGGKIDWTFGHQEQLHIEQTGGTVQVNLLNISYEGAIKEDRVWNMQLIAGEINHQWDELVNPRDLIDVSSLGYIIGSGENALIMQQQLLRLDGVTPGKNGVGLAGMTLEVVAPESKPESESKPEPSTSESLSVG